ncbi:MAG: hypothetical protein M3R51_07895 [Candidatus Eremiobacteraeota bacterium]|nr:hypothetical protein [Candidatus Eremiobacteraeota bacterium]
MKWLRPQTTARVGLRPHRTLEVPRALADAYDCALVQLEAALGANVAVDDRPGRFIEAGFGVINNERVRITFDPIDAARTSVRIEAFFRAGAAVPQRSAAVEALAAAILRATAA